MSDYALPALYALFLWWFTTGAILYLDRLPQRTFKWSMAGAAVLCSGALWGLAASSDDVSEGGAYAAFTSGLLIWGWQEISFYMGYVTGPRRTMCAKGCSGWPHFLHALQVSLWHEISILVSAGLCLWLTWEAPNQLGLWTFLILWGMHESARLNVFLGVRNVNEEFLPDHLVFLKSFLTVKPMNLLFPVSITISTVATAWVAQQAWGATAAFETAAFSFLAALMTLAVFEHWFLMLPLPAAKLWNWSLPPQAAYACMAPPAAAGEDTPRGKAASAPCSAFVHHPADFTEADLHHKAMRRVGVRRA